MLRKEGINLVTKYQIICLATDYARTNNVGEEVVYGGAKNPPYDTIEEARRDLTLARNNVSGAREPGFESYAYFIREVEIEELEEVLIRQINTKVPFHKKPDGNWLNVSEIKEALRELIEDGTIKVSD